MFSAACSTLTALALAASTPPSVGDGGQGLRFGPFGDLTVYQPSGPPRSVALFVSGDGGWTLGVVGMAERLRALGALVVGIDIRRYLSAVGSAPGPCTYAAGDFEALSQYIQKRLGLEHYLAPVLVGYSSGATLVYVAVAESPPTTFRGALSLGFCPDLPGKRAWCAGPGRLRADPLRRGGWSFQPLVRLPAPWIVLQGDDDQVCSPALAADYIAGIDGAEIIKLPKVGHGFGVESRWGPAFDQAYRRIVAAPGSDQEASPGPVSDLPLVEVPPPAGAPATDRFAVMLSGDGGWAGLDREVSQRLAARGIPVVGLNSLQYFWRARTPQQLGHDLARIVAHYQARWHGNRVLILGYSFGADVAPFAVANLPSAVRAHVAGVGLLGIGQTASFEFRVGDWIGRKDENEYPTSPALQELPGLVRPAPVVCLFGAEEIDSGCRAHPGVQAIRLPGGHHLGGDYGVLADRLLALLGGTGG